MDDLERRETWAARINPRVAEFRAGAMRMDHELRQIFSVRDVHAAEAVILYGCRILESIAADAMTAIDLAPSHNIFSNLVALGSYNLFSKEIGYWAHALRRMGNAARHLQAECSADDGELSLCFVEKWIDWYFRTYPLGLLLERLTTDSEPLNLCNEPELRSLVERFVERVSLRNCDGDLSWIRPFIARSSVVPALAAEIWLDCADTKEARARARELLNEALERHPDDLRLRQLMGLAWSRDHEYAKALSWLEPLVKRYRDDDETSGICAGAYKRQWQNEHDSDALAKSNRMYLRAWKQSSKGNPYLGINAASTTLFLGSEEESQTLAGEVRSLLDGRFERLARRRKLTIEPGYWDRVTLAEALLIERKFAESATHYRDAFKRYGKEKGSIESTSEQMRAIL
ncbi:MAG TPA: tetratricopeptide repeat-containing protein, partial [Pirellulales bacterium]|nr:tetratricopeptide repeat-containing protein [Pirellulales bacterium]